MTKEEFDEMVKEYFQDDSASPLAAMLAEGEEMLESGIKDHDPGLGLKIQEILTSLKNLDEYLKNVYGEKYGTKSS